MYLGRRTSEFAFDPQIPASRTRRQLPVQGDILNFRITTHPRLRAPLRARIALLATAVTTLCLVAAGPAGATNLSVSTDAHQAGAATTLNLTTTLTGSGNATRQYGATFQLGSALVLDWWKLGAGNQRCSGASFSSINTGYTPTAMAFSKSACPSAAKVGTATLGGASGGIYVVNTTPVPSFGVYFDSGISTPYGRKLNVSYNGSAPTLSIYGLKNTSTSGLSLSFYNASRPALSSKIWSLAESWSDGCEPSPQVYAGVYTFPYSGTVATLTNLSGVSLNITGCGILLTVATDSSTADTETSLQIDTPLTGTGNDTHQYGAAVTLPPSLHLDWTALGASNQRCSGASFSALNTGITPAAMSFSKTVCPNTAKVGTVTLGAASGTIYSVNTTPLPSFGVYFDSGVTTPYGRKVYLNYSGSTPTLTVTGLPNAASSGLSMVFSNPSRPTLPARVWRFAESGDPDCAPADALATVFTWPASGSAATETIPLTSYVDVTGC